MKWTKGPLEVLADGDESSSVIVGQQTEPFNDVAEFLHSGRHIVDMTREEAVANATLYAAALDLAQAGAALVAWLEDDEDRRELEPSCNECTQGSTPLSHDKGPCPYHRMRAALAKAGAA